MTHSLSFTNSLVFKNIILLIMLEIYNKKEIKLEDFATLVTVVSFKY